MVNEADEIEAEVEWISTDRRHRHRFMRTHYGDETYDVCSCGYRLEPDAYIASLLEAHVRNVPSLVVVVDDEWYWPRRIGEFVWVTPFNNGNRLKMEDVLPGWLDVAVRELTRDLS